MAIKFLEKEFQFKRGLNISRLFLIQVLKDLLGVTQMQDKENPQYWFLLMLEALVGLRNNNQEPAKSYLRFVEINRSRQEATAAMGRLRNYQKKGYFPDAIKKIEAIKADFETINIG